MTDTRLFVFDVDGTLLTSQFELSSKVRESVASLVSSGHHVALASARPPKSVALISEDLLGKVTEIVSLNGALITHGQKTLQQKTISASSAETIIQKARHYDLEINLLSEWHWFVEHVGAGINAEANVLGFPPEKVEDLIQPAREAAHKILLIGQPSTVRAFRDWLTDVELDVMPSLSKTNYCEVVANGVSKSNAVAFLAQKLQLSMEYVIAFGDGDNDLPMIASAGTGIAMGNAMMSVKQVADFVTKSNDEDGIPKALQKLGYL